MRPTTPSLSSLQLRLAVAVLSLSIFGAACASSARSVRAVRQYQKEPPRLSAALDRLADMDACLGLVEEILVKTPYSPGDPWVQQLALNDASAAVIEASLRQKGQIYQEAALRVPVAKIYRVHVEEVLSKRPRGDDGSKKYPNLLEALGDLVKGGEVGRLWGEMDKKLARVGELGSVIKQTEDKRKGIDPQKQKAAYDQITAQINGLENELDGLEEGLEADKTALVTAMQGMATGEGETGVMLQDILAAASVVARLELEAFALAPIVGVNLVRAIQDLPGAVKADLSLQGAISMVDLKNKVFASPALLASIATRLQNQSAILIALAEKLAGIANVSLSATPGYAFAESASSQVVGFAMDSFYLDLKVGAEAFFFHNFDNDELDNTEGQAQNQNLTFDLTGRERKLKYAVEPIVLATFNLDAGFDLGNIPNFLDLDFGYETDRVYRSGGTIEESNDVFEHLGVNNAVTDVISAGLALMGVQTRVKIASFTAGNVGVFDANTDVELAVTPLQFKLTQIDLSYDLMWLIDNDELHSILDAMPVGIRYLDYQLPRIVYEYEDTNGDPEVDNFVYVAESDPQLVRSQYFMAGVDFQRGTRPSHSSRFIFNLGVFLGGGPSSFFPRDDPEERRAKAAFSGIFTGAIGFAIPFLDPQNTLQIDLDLIYEAQLILGTFIETNTNQATDENGQVESDLGQRSRNFGGFDLFHGPKLRFSMNF